MPPLWVLGRPWVGHRDDKTTSLYPDYKGQFYYVDHYLADAPETGHGPVRSVIVFRLRPREGVQRGPNRSKVDALGTEPVREVPVEQHLTESMLIEPGREPHAAERREQKLVRAYLAYLAARGDDVCRLQLRPDGEPAPMFYDLFDKTTNTLVEAKGSVARPAFRMAIGQLADYRRLVEPAPQQAILVPERPRQDLIRLAESQGMLVVWPSGAGFETANAR